MSEIVADYMQTDRASVLIGTDYGLEEFAVSVVAPDQNGVPTNVTDDTEYVYLTAEQSSAYARQQFEVVRPNRTAPNYLGIFAVIFSGTPDSPEGSTVLSLNKLRHQELIENQARAGE